jgi:ectoine hydroxylase-related dioxygenase (phytanoyl-CoA dioxygenase family)
MKLENITRENIKIHSKKIHDNGFTILKNVLTENECNIISNKLDKINSDEIEEFGVKRLEKHNEIGILRSLIAKDEYFANIILHPKVYPLISEVIGETSILHLQNAIITKPNKKHGQSHFHRDFPKDFVSSKLLSLNVFWMIDDFNEETGATWIVPGTHMKAEWPSEEYLQNHALQIKEKKGSVLIFDSMLIHRGGTNTSKAYRRAINHQFTKSFIKQQINLPSFLGDKYNKESKIGQILGYWSIPPKNIQQFRCEPKDRTYRSGQG